MTPDYETEAREHSDMAPEPTLLANLVTDDCIICDEEDATIPVKLYAWGHIPRKGMAHPECYD